MSELIFPAFLLLLFGTAAIMDFKTRLVPNWLTMGGLAGIAVLTLIYFPNEMATRLLAAATFLGLGFALFARNALGGGAVKLLICVGMGLGFVGGILALVVAALAIVVVARPKSGRTVAGAGWLGVAAVIVTLVGVIRSPAGGADSRLESIADPPRLSPIERAAHRCTRVPNKFISAVRGDPGEGFPEEFRRELMAVVSPGITFRNWQMVNGHPSDFQGRSDLPEIWYVAAEVDGPEYQGQRGDVGVWEIWILTDGGLVISALAGVARDVTQWDSANRASPIEGYAVLAHDCVLALP